MDKIKREGFKGNSRFPCKIEILFFIFTEDTFPLKQARDRISKMPAIIDTVPARNTKSNSFRPDSEKSYDATVKRLMKEQERVMRESKNIGGKNTKKQSARTAIILAETMDKREEEEDEEEKQVIGQSQPRVVLKRQKRKVGHRAGGGYNIRF